MLRPTEIPYPSRVESRVDKSKGTELQKESEQNVLPETTPKVNPPLCKVKQETQEVAQEKRPIDSKKLTADGVLKIVEHDSFVSFRGLSIPLSTDFAETVLPLISNQMSLAHFKPQKLVNLQFNIVNKLDPINLVASLIRVYNALIS